MYTFALTERYKFLLAIWQENRQKLVMFASKHREVIFGNTYDEKGSFEGNNLISIELMRLHYLLIAKRH